MTEEQLATEVGIYAQRNFDIDFSAKCSRLLELIKNLEIDSFMSEGK